MEQKHVSKELAQKLKQIGFDWPVNTVYMQHAGSDSWIEDIDEVDNHNDSYSFYMSRPTIETAATFLRERKGLHVSVSIYHSTSIWQYWIQDLNGNDNVAFTDGFDDHDTAYTAGIEHAVDYELKKLNDETSNTRNNTEQI